jgi:hypothetical protein
MEDAVMAVEHINLSEETYSFLLSAPSLEQIAAHHPSDLAQARMRYLFEMQRAGTLTPDERDELDEAVQLEKVMGVLKAMALRQLRK